MSQSKPNSCFFSSYLLIFILLRYVPKRSTCSIAMYWIATGFHIHMTHSTIEFDVGSPLFVLYKYVRDKDSMKRRQNELQAGSNGEYETKKNIKYCNQLYLWARIEKVPALNVSLFRTLLFPFETCISSSIFNWTKYV